MINLLPPEEKAKILSEKTKKLIIILGITIIIPIVCFLLVLLSIEFYIKTQVNSQKAVLEQAKQEYQTPNFLMFKDIIQKNDNVLVTLLSFYKKQTYMTQALAVISSLDRPKNLYLNNVSLNRGEMGAISVSITGFSGSREDLLVFQKTMNEASQIQDINFSPESWVSPKNTVFNVTFQIKK